MHWLHMIPIKAELFF